MLIKEISDSDKAEYAKLVAEYGTVYNTLDWVKIYGDKVRLIGIYDKGNHLIGGFTIYEEKKFSLRIFRNPPFTPAIGPFLKIDAKNHITVMSVWKKVLSLMAEFIEDSRFSIVSFSLDKKCNRYPTVLLEKIQSDSGVHLSFGFE